MKLINHIRRAINKTISEGKSPFMIILGKKEHKQLFTEGNFLFGDEFRFKRTILTCFEGFPLEVAPKMTGFHVILWEEE